MAKRLQRRIFFLNRPIRNKNCLWQPCLLTDQDEMCNLYRGSSIDAFYPVSVHLAKWFQRRRFFFNRPIRNKNCLWRSCLLMNRDDISNFHRGPSINLPIKFRFIWTSSFRGEEFLKIDQSETRIACGGHVCSQIRTKCAILIEDLP